MLPSFDVIYDRFDALIRHEDKIIGRSFEELNEITISRLVEAYAVACGAIEEKSVRRTSSWPRQSGASATAIAMLVENPNIVIMNHAWNATVNVSRRIKSFSLTEEKNVIDQKHVRCLALTDTARKLQVRPKLVIFDSCTTFRDGIEDRIQEAHDMYQCGILIFPCDRH